MFKKIILSFVILTFLSALILYFFGSKILSRSIKSGVETYGPEVTQTPVRLDEVKLSVLSGNGTLTGLYVGNPEGFKSENIFAMGQIDIDIEARTLTSDEIVINRIYISEPHISYEKTLRTSNLKELLKNIEEYSKGDGDIPDSEEPEPDAPEEEEEETEPGKNILIRKFIIEKPNVFIGVMGMGTTVPLPSIELTNIQSSEEKIAAAILKEVINALFENIQKASNNVAGATNDATGQILDSVDKPLKDVNEGIKNLFGK